MDRKLLVAAISGALLAGAALPVSAKVSQAEADKLKGELTPVGGVRAANKDGSIPAWDGGLTKPASCFKGEGERYCDPFPDDKPKFEINAGNHEQYKEQLSAGQITMFKTYGETYKIPVYETRRTFANPQFIYDATYKNATSAELGGNGEALNGAVTGIPFPIPKNGHEVIWNHKVRFRDISATRWNNQFAVTTSGNYNQVKIREDVLFSYSKKGIKPADLNNVILYFLQITTEPPKLAGTILLVHETMDQVKEARRAWQYNPGQRRLRRAPDVGYDNPGTGADGLRFNDQTDTFNGAMNRYAWKLVGKREMYVPSSNSYKLHSDEYKYSDIVKRGHIDQDLTRYELRRVWIVDATNEDGMDEHQYGRRVFYVDEDSWQIVLVDIYDKRGQLWRFQEAHTVIAYDKPYQLPIAETVYDFQNGRYLVQALNNEEPETAAAEFDDSYFAPNAVKKHARR